MDITFWRLVIERRSTSGIPTVVRHGDSESNNAKSAANLFADYFESVYAPGQSTPSPPCGPPNQVINECTLFHESVLNALQQLDTNKGAGPDGLPNFIIKGLAAEMATPLVHLFNLITRAVWEMQIFETRVIYFTKRKVG